MAALASLSVCQSINAQLVKGLKTIDLKKVSRRDAVVQADDQIMTNVRTGKTTLSLQTSKNIMDVPDFMARLTTLMKTIVFVSTMHLAPIETWEGRADYGVVRGVRYQVAQADADVYIEFWRACATKFKDRVGLLISQEQAVRATWISMHDTQRFSLASCMRQSIIDNRALVYLAAAPVTPVKKVPGRTNPGGGKPSDGKKQFDVKSLPGFKPDIRTFQGIHDDGNGKKAKFCKFYNDGRGCYKTSGDCPNHHRCDVCKPDGEPCFQDHPRKDHP
jgi:hypothetical protein